MVGRQVGKTKGPGALDPRPLNFKSGGDLLFYRSPSRFQIWNLRFAILQPEIPSLARMKARPYSTIGG